MKNENFLTGREAIINVIINQLNKYIKQVMRRGVRDHITAEKIVWQVFHRFLARSSEHEQKGFDQIQKEISIGCKWKAIDFLRGKYVKLHIHKVPLEEDMQSTQDSFFSNMEFNDLITKSKLIEDLNEEQKQILEFLIYDYNLKEIACLLNIPINKVYQTKYVLKRKLHELYMRLKKEKN